MGSPRTRLVGLLPVGRRNQVLVAASITLLLLAGAAFAGVSGPSGIIGAAPPAAQLMDEPNAGTTGLQAEVAPAATADDPAELDGPSAEAAPDLETVSDPVAEPDPEPGIEETLPDRVALVPAPERLSAFAGLSTWIDVYDIEWTPEEQVHVAHLAGVDTIFVQSARYASEHDIDDAARLGALVDAAHARGIKVMTWYIPDFLDPERDLRRSQAAIAFTSPNGNRPDAFGLDIELDSERDITVRNQRLFELSAALRAWTGPDYPMAAIVLPPLQLDLNGTWWPGFPYAELRPFYDVYIPMSYSSYRGTDAEKTYSWNLENILQTRVRAGDPDLPIHMAGGIADNLPEVGAFVQAVADGMVLGAGLYDLHTMPSSSWGPLQQLRLTPGTAGEVPSLVGP
jgi:hypothetical protein